MVNIWGSVCEYDVCAEHAEMHAKLVDDFPLRAELRTPVERCVTAAREEEEQKRAGAAG
jgi:hypothetical protein